MYVRQTSFFLFGGPYIEQSLLHKYHWPILQNQIDLSVLTFCWSFFFHQAFDKEELIKCLSKLISVEKEWVPYSTTSTLYIRPTFISTEVSCRVKGESRVRGGGGLCKLIIVEKEWVSYSITSTLYIRPTFISTEVSVRGKGLFQKLEAPPLKKTNIL